MWFTRRGKKGLLLLLLSVVAIIPVASCSSFSTEKSYAIIEQPLLIDGDTQIPLYVFPFYFYTTDYKITVGDLERLVNKLFNAEGSDDLLFIKIGDKTILLECPTAPISRQELCGKIGEATYKHGNTTRTFYFQAICFSPSDARYANMLKPFADTYSSNLYNASGTSTQNLHIHVVDVETGEPVPSVSVWLDRKLVGYTDIYGNIEVKTYAGKHTILGLSPTHIGAYWIDTSGTGKKSIVLPIVNQVYNTYRPFHIINSANKTYMVVFPRYYDLGLSGKLPPIPPTVIAYANNSEESYMVIYSGASEKTAFNRFTNYICDSSKSIKDCQIQLLELWANVTLGTTLMILDDSGQVAHGLNIRINSKSYNLTDGFLYYPSTKIVNLTYKKGQIYNYVLAHIEPERDIEITIRGKDYEKCKIRYQQRNGDIHINCAGCDCLWSISNLNKTTTLYKSTPRQVFIPMPSNTTNGTNETEISLIERIPHLQILAIILKRNLVPTITLPNISTPCTKGWPAHMGEIITYNEPNFACDLFEVNDSRLRTIVKKIYSECYLLVTENRSRNSIYSWYIHTYLPLYSNEKLSLEDKLKICAGLRIIELLSSSSGPMNGYFYPEVCCSKTEWCPKKDYFGRCEPKDDIFSKNALSLTCKGEVSQYPRGWVSDTDMSKNSCVLSDLPAHVSMNILKTGTCADYSIVLTTLLRIAGFSSDEVYTVRGSLYGGHLYNLVKFPGDYKYTIVDTTGNNPFSINLQNVPGNKEYCNYDVDKCSNDEGFTRCPPKWQVWGC